MSTIELVYDKEVIMTVKRKVEIYSAGCPVCEETIKLVNSITCDSCEIIVHDMYDKTVAKRALALGVNSIPAIAINGELAEYCKYSGIDENLLRNSGIGQPLPS